MDKSDIVRKLTSRKFWLSAAAFLAAFFGGVSGVLPAGWCAVGMALSAGIYAACEAYVDGANAKATTSAVVTTIEARSNDAETVRAFVGQSQEE